MFAGILGKHVLDSFSVGFGGIENIASPATGMFFIEMAHFAPLYFRLRTSRPQAFRHRRGFRGHREYRVVWDYLLPSAY
jgi:hypothetical protein